MQRSGGRDASRGPVVPRRFPKQKGLATMSAIDDSLDSLISNTIQKHPHLKRRRVHFETQEGRVVLRGTVSSYYQKQMAQEAVRRVQGVDSIENRLEVDWSMEA